MQPENNATSIGHILKTITIIHLALTAGCIFFLVMIASGLQGELIYEFPKDSIALIAFVLPLVIIPMGRFVSKNMLDKTPNDIGLRQKLAQYQTALIVQCAIIEGPALFAIISFKLTVSIYPLVLAVALIGFLFLQRPSKTKIEAALNLSREEKMELNKA